LALHGEFGHPGRYETAQRIEVGFEVSPAAKRIEQGRIGEHRAHGAGSISRRAAVRLPVECPAMRCAAAVRRRLLAPLGALALTLSACGGDGRTPLVVYSPHGRDLLQLF